MVPYDAHNRAATSDSKLQIGVIRRSGSCDYYAAFLDDVYEDTTCILPSAQLS